MRYPADITVEPLEGVGGFLYAVNSNGNTNVYLRLKTSLSTYPMVAALTGPPPTGRLSTNVAFISHTVVVGGFIYPNEVNDGGVIDLAVGGEFGGSVRSVVLASRVDVIFTSDIPVLALGIVSGGDTIDLTDSGPAGSAASRRWSCAMTARLARRPTRTVAGRDL